jgi:hypothetical protein
MPAFKNLKSGMTERDKMDLRKTLTVVLAVLLVFMMCYLTFLRNKKPKAAVKPTPAAAADAAAAPADCAGHKKAIIKPARTIKESALWDSTKGPYLVTGDLVVAKGAVFTVKPGVVIKFEKGVNFVCNGKLVAKGTKAKPIYFTSVNDDSVGGDTNCDKGAVKPAAGDYGKIIIKNKTSVKNCNFSYAESLE